MTPAEEQLRAQVAALELALGKRNQQIEALTKREGARLLADAALVARVHAAQHQAEVWRARAGRLADALRPFASAWVVGACVVCRGAAEVEAGNTYDFCQACDASLTALEESRRSIYSMLPQEVLQWAAERVRRKLGSIP